MKAEPPIAKTKPPRHSAPDKVVVKHVSSPVELPTNLARTNILANMTRDVPPPIQIRNQARIEQPIEQPAVSVPVVLAAQSEQRFGTVTSIEVRNHQTEVVPLPSSLLLNFAKLPETIIGEELYNIADNSGNVEKIYGDDESYDFAQSVSEYNIGEVVPTVHDLADAPEQSPDYDWTELEFGLNAVIDDAIEPAETIEPSYTVEPAEMIGATAEQFADTVQQSIGSLLIAAEFAVFEAAVDITSEPTSKFIQSETTKPTLVEINDPVAEHEDFRQTLHTVIEQTVSERPERAAEINALYEVIMAITADTVDKSETQVADLLADNPERQQYFEMACRRLLYCLDLESHDGAVNVFTLQLLASAAPKSELPNNQPTVNYLRDGTRENQVFFLDKLSKLSTVIIPSWLQILGKIAVTPATAYN